jgi:hypothetical protein
MGGDVAFFLDLPSLIPRFTPWKGDFSKTHRNSDQVATQKSGYSVFVLMKGPL